MTVKNVKDIKQHSKEWCSAYHKLIHIVHEQPFVSEYTRSVSVTSGEQTIYLPAYIPYIGISYFAYRPRVLCYAINQNLSPHVPWTEDWVTQWAADRDKAYDRLNYAAKEGLAIPIKPYAEGFIPLVALMAIWYWNQRSGGLLPLNIDKVVAVTNFVKFSTVKDASSSSIPAAWWRECGNQYVIHEIRVLQPDIILGFGKKTVIELKRVLNNSQLSNHIPKLIECRFPARMASSKSKPLLIDELKLWESKILPLIDRICKPKENSFHKWKIQQYSNYFINIFNSWGVCNKNYI